MGCPSCSGTFPRFESLAALNYIKYRLHNILFLPGDQSTSPILRSLIKLQAELGLVKITKVAPRDLYPKLLVIHHSEEYLASAPAPMTRRKAVLINRLNRHERVLKTVRITILQIGIYSLFSRNGRSFGGICTIAHCIRVQTISRSPVSIAEIPPRGRRKSS